jgi:hypothetical protein
MDTLPLCIGGPVTVARVKWFGFGGLLPLPSFAGGMYLACGWGIDEDEGPAVWNEG